MKVAAIVVGIALLALVIGGGLWLYTPDKPRAALEAVYARPPSEFLTVAGIRLHVRDTGPRTAPAVFLLHGFGSSLQTWDAWSDALSTDHRVIRFDLPGFGLTGPDPTGDYTDARAMQVLAALMDRLGIAHASLIGNSMGGRIAWEFAAANPTRVHRLVLISPDGFASPGIEYGKAVEVPLMVRMLPYMLPTALLRMSLAPAYADPAHMTGAMVQRYRDMLLAPGVRDAVIARMRQVVLTDPVPRLRGLHVPVLLLWGQKDAMIPVSNAADYRAALPDSTLAILPDLGHVPQEEAPAISLPPVRAFLDG